MTKIMNDAVIITGCSTGIGRSAALKLARCGYAIFATVRKETDAKSLTNEAHGEIYPVLADITKAEDIEQFKKYVLDNLNGRKIVALVNNAGVLFNGPLEFIAMDDLRMQFEVNVFAQIAVTQAFLPKLRESAGRVLNVGSVAGEISVPFVSPLSASKYAMESFNEALRMELNPFGIKVIMIAPGEILTEGVDKAVENSNRVYEALSDEAKELYGKRLKTMTERLGHTKKIGIPAERCAEAILRAIEDKRPKTRYRIGLDAIFLPRICNLIPDRLLDIAKLITLKLR